MQINLQAEACVSLPFHPLDLGSGNKHDGECLPVILNRAVFVTIKNMPC